MSACVRLEYFCVGGVRGGACVRVLDYVSGNSENVQTVFKVRELMYCAVVQMYVKIFLTRFMSASIICVHSCL